MYGIFITARLGSTRLPDKHLKPVAGKPIMQYLLERICYGLVQEGHAEDVKVIITTSAEEMNTRFRQFEPLADVFFGDIKNIPLRHYQAALTHNIDSIIAVDGDDILCSPQAMIKVKKQLEQGCDYVTTEGLPFGLNTFGYSVNFLKEALQENKEEVLETGWGRIFDHSEPEIIRFPEVEEHKNTLRFTLDYNEDLDFFQRIIETVGAEIESMADQDLIDFVLENEIYKHNQFRIEEYWQNFHSQKEDYG